MARLVLGAAGGVGHAVVKALLARKLPVRVLVRDRARLVRALGPAAEAVQVVVADALDRQAVLRAAQGATHLYHAVNPPYRQWPAVALPALDNTLAAAGATGAKVVFPGNVYVYGPTGTRPVSEDHPHTPNTHLGALREQMERRLMEAHETGEAQVAIGRFPDFYGPNANNLEIVPPPRRPMMWGVSPGQPHEFIYIDDVGEALVTLGESGEAWGRDWNVPGPELITGERWAGLVEEVLGYRPPIRVIQGWMLQLMGLFNGQIGGFAKVFYLWERPLRLDGSSWRRAFGPVPTRPYRDGIRLTAQARGQAPVARDEGRASAGGGAPPAASDRAR